MGEISTQTIVDAVKDASIQANLELGLKGMIGKGKRSMTPLAMIFM